MRHQRQPNHWSCLPTSFANLLDVDVQDIINFLGHDGSSYDYEEPAVQVPRSLGDVVYKDALRRRAFHIQEMVEYCYSRGLVVAVLYNKIYSSNGYETLEYKSRMDLRYYINRENGVLIGLIKNRPHAVTWFDKMIYDPNGTVYALDKFNVEMFCFVK